MNERAAPSLYPLRVEGQLDDHVSRGLWLVKWVLLIPHFIVLGFLWLAFVVLPVVAFFAILFTGRHPRGIFEFKLGVMRWSWRVAFYSYSALGTDRYPPFTLSDVPDYPARLHVDYPQELSRGLVLVKWWLLALPHYLVVGVFVGGAWAGVNAANHHVRWTSGGGLGQPRETSRRVDGRGGPDRMPRADRRHRAAVPPPVSEGDLRLRHGDE